VPAPGAEPAWLALGLELVLRLTGGRRTPVDLSEPLTYCPNWGLAWMTGTEQTGAAVLCGTPSPFRPGDHGRVVVVPFYDELLDQWHRVVPGDRLTAFEGSKVVGTGTVAWLRRTASPAELRGDPPPELVRWAEGGPEPT